MSGTSCVVVPDARACPAITPSHLGSTRAVQSTTAAGTLSTPATSLHVLPNHAFTFA
jgi:hypothetical protein